MKGKHNRQVNINYIHIIYAIAIVFFVLVLMNLKGISSYFQTSTEKVNSLLINPKYTVTFNSNTGTGSMSDQVISYNTMTKLSKNIYRKTGFTFINWNTKADNTGETYTEQQEVSDLGDIILYAQWEQNPTRYAVQIYGINQDVDENDQTLGLTFGPATGANYNNAYVTHRYVENEEGTYNIEIVTTTVNSNGDETESIEELFDCNGINVTRTAEQVQERQNINLHEMTWKQIAAVPDKTLFEDCMLCGDTKRVELTLNNTIKTTSVYDQYGDGAGILGDTVNYFYRKWNPSQSQNSYVGSEESGVILDENEIDKGSNARGAGGYSSSHIRATLVGEDDKTNRGYAGDVNLTSDTCIFSCIQEDLRELIAPKKVKYITGTNYTDGNYTINSDIVDTIWLFSDREVRGTGIYSGNELEGLGDSGDAYSKFVEPESKSYIDIAHDNATEIRMSYYEIGSANVWWLRSSALFNTNHIRGVDYNGNVTHYVAYSTLGLRFWLLYLRFKI